MCAEDENEDEEENIEQRERFNMMGFE